MAQPATATKKQSPNAKLSMSAAGRLRLASRERLRLEYYNDGGKNKGHCTYGYGTLVHRGVCTEEELTITVTNEMADASLTSRIRDAENAIRRNVTQELNQEQFDALVSFVYNTGPTGAIAVFERLNAGEFEAAADVISSRTHSRQNAKLVHLKGLVSRRTEESAPFRPEKE
ncbi:lysozyme [Trinickia mobilis]|uniref:lysozyme n=1 Tax=Trinickia mobilis TaxID=2816356 RepID=UPI001A8F476A|nr:lysozyme [Trinickia mobilis]